MITVLVDGQLKPCEIAKLILSFIIFYFCISTASRQRCSPDSHDFARVALSSAIQERRHVLSEEVSILIQEAMATVRIYDQLAVGHFLLECEAVERRKHVVVLRDC
jgi:hypothetical protein